MKTMSVDFQGGLLVAILILAGLLRLLYLGSESIWLDEGYSVMVASSDLHRVVSLAIRDVHPPFYYLLLHGWMKLFGTSEFAFRLLSALFGWLAVYVIYRVGRLLFDEEVGLVSALLLALSEFHIFYSQETRSYSLMAFLSLASIYFFVQALRTRGISARAGYVLSSVLLMYTHAFGLFIILAQNLYFASRYTLGQVERAAWRTHLRLQAWLVILFLPWAGVLKRQIARVQSHFWVPEPSPSSLLDSLATYSGSGALLLMFLVMALIAAFHPFLSPAKGAGGAATASPDAERLPLLAAWLATPTILPFLLSLVCAPIYLTRVTIGASLAFYLFVARGLSLLRPRGLKLAALSAVVALSLVNAHAYYGRVGEQEWREAVRYVESKARSGDFVLCNISGQCAFDYYAKRGDLRRRRFRPSTTNINDQNACQLLPQVAEADRFWLLVSLSCPGASRPLRRVLGPRYSLKDEKAFPGLEVYLFERIPGGGQ